MGREIKFRAWNGKEMSDNVATLQEIAEKEYAFETKNLVWLQFTGILDKNGVEMYEGDIVSNGVLPMIVEWSGRTASFVTISNKKGFVCYGMKAPYSEKNEVIGNIYENPELLDG